MTILKKQINLLLYNILVLRNIYMSGDRIDILLFIKEFCKT